MEQQISIQTEDKYNFLQIAKWGKFMAIVGFVFTGFMLLFGLFFGTFMSSFMGSFQHQALPFNIRFLSFFYMLIASLYFFPTLYLYRFSVKTKLAIKSDDQELYTSAVYNLKRLFVFMGVLTAVILIIYGLFFVVGMAGGMIGAAMYNA